jgi:hypothetical protein
MSKWNLPGGKGQAARKVIYEPIVWKMWASTACKRDSLTSTCFFGEKDSIFLHAIL